MLDCLECTNFLLKYWSVGNVSLCASGAQLGRISKNVTDRHFIIIYIDLINLKEVHHNIGVGADPEDRTQEGDHKPKKMHF